MTDTIRLSGIVRHVFAHRFTIEADDGTHLADLGPKGAERVALRPGAPVTIEGERKPSEIKVARITIGGETIAMPHGDRHDHPPADPATADPVLARKAARAAGLDPLGEPRRKPKHFEVLGRDGGGQLHELHVELDGSVRKRKPVEAGEGKWAEALGGS